jgi:hypothetical protein
LELTEDYIIDEAGNAYVQISYKCSNESDEPVSGFSKKLMKEFDSTNINIVGFKGPVRDVSERVERGRKIIEWIIERDTLRKGDPCVCLLRAKWIGFALKLGRLYMAKVSYSPDERVDYTLSIRLPKLSQLEKRLWKRLIYKFSFTSNPPPDEPVDTRKLELKWRRYSLNSRFDAMVSYGFKYGLTFRAWLRYLLSALIPTLVIEFLLRVVLRW